MTSIEILKGIIAVAVLLSSTAFVILFCAAIAHRDSDEESRNEH